jgi:hypothetical protein
MSATTFDLIVKAADILIKLAVLIVGVIWAHKVLREYKYRIQLDIDANLYKLKSPVEAVPVTPFEVTRADTAAKISHPYAVEVLLKFANKGRTRFRLYNARIEINTMPDEDSQVKLDAERGHLHLKRIFSSGNVVQIFEVEGKPEEETSFYYIEPGIVQTIHYLALIAQPRDLLQIVAGFSMEQRRFSLKDMRSRSGLYPHGAARTFQIRPDGGLAPGAAPGTAETRASP